MGRLHAARAERLQGRREGVRGGEPRVKVRVVGGINDDKIIAASRGGKAPDVAQSFSADNSGAFCGSGAWVDLKPYMDRDGISDRIFPPAPRSYTQFKGTRCALPMLADAKGLYYNEDMLKKAGLDGPPKTVSELTDYAKKLTVKNPDGSLKVVGFNPVMGWYSNTPANFGPMFGGKWVDDNGKSTLCSDPAWAKLLKWQKDLIDWYGYDKLVKFQAGLGDEFSASNAFEKGKVAMNVDGEWRTAFIADEAPNLNYGTAPVPVDDDNPDLYGGGYTTGNIIGIPKRAEHPGAGLGAAEVPGHRRQGDGAALQRAAQRPDHRVVGEVARPQARPEVRDVPEDLREPEHDDDAGHRRRQRQPGAVQQLRQQVAGRAGRRPAGGPGRRRQADRRPARERRGRSRCRDRGAPASQEPRASGAAASRSWRS